MLVFRSYHQPVVYVTVPCGGEATDSRNAQPLFQKSEWTAPVGRTARYSSTASSFTGHYNDRISIQSEQYHQQSLIDLILQIQLQVQVSVHMYKSGSLGLSPTLVQQRRPYPILLFIFRGQVPRSLYLSFFT